MVFALGALLAVACSSGDGIDEADDAPAEAEAEAEVEEEAPVPAVSPVADLDGAAALGQQLSHAWVGYVGSVVTAGRADPDRAAELAALHDPALAFDGAALEACVVEKSSVMDASLWEHSSWRDHGNQTEVDPELSVIVILDNLVTGTSDSSVDSTVVVGPEGIVGRLDEPDPGGGSIDEHLALVGCLTSAVTMAPELVDGIDRLGIVEPGLDGNYDHRAFFSAAGGDGDGEVARRDGFPADPADPEPIQSTGSNEWDLISTDDPSAFNCVEYLGQGPEEFLATSKEGGYSSVPDAHLYRARFDDDTTIDIRIHPELGSKEAVDAEIERYLVPLGQLPTVLRRDIGRFAVRVGGNTATASQGEGMMVQTENATVRIADNRLEETLFHESVHTSLDPRYAYQKSQEWLEAQEADGRWLTEYGRENPDGEDLAETALYAYALQHHPERFPAGMVDEIEARVPNRLAFIEKHVFPPDQPPIAEGGGSVTCAD